MRRYITLGLFLLNLSNTTLAQVPENSQLATEILDPAMQVTSRETDLDTTITSDRFDLALEKGEGVFIGNVKIIHPEYTIIAEAADIEFVPNRPDSIRRFIARGNVHWKAVGKEGTCGLLDYEPLQQRITLRTKAIAKVKQRTFYGDWFIWDQKKNRLVSMGRSRIEFHE